MSFRVLLSHAHDDASVAGWMRRRAVAHRTPSSLVGTRGALGPVPGRLKFSPPRRARGDVNFDESQALIVLCSSSAANDSQVNDDIDAFMASGRMRRIVPVIVPNAPETPDVERDYFPPALCGRGLFTVDLRERRNSDVLSGDGREGGWLKLVAELLGIDIARLAQHEGRRHNARAAALTLSLAVCALVALVAVVDAARSREHATSISAERQLAAGNAMRALQLRREALAVADERAAEQAAASQELTRAKGTLLATVRDIGALTDTILVETGEDRSGSAGALIRLTKVEQIYLDLGDVSSFFDIRPPMIISTLERISTTYSRIGHGDEARRVAMRLARLSARVSHDRSASPAWRIAYASAMAAIADQRAVRGDDEGRESALQQAARIYEDVCLASPLQPNASTDDARVNSCLRFSVMVLTRARQQSEAQQSIDELSLRRARLALEALIAAYPNSADIQSRAMRVRDQIDRTVESTRAPSTSR